jgi:hypothetical protein
VGGIKEKVLAARAAGITRVFLPDRNEADLDEIRGEDLLSGLTFTYVEHVSTVLDQILTTGKKPRGRRPGGGSRAGRSGRTGAAKPKAGRAAIRDDGETRT